MLAITNIKDYMDATEAIQYALESLEPWEIHMFLTDWQNKADLSSWMLTSNTESDWTNSEDALCVSSRTNESRDTPCPTPLSYTEEIRYEPT